MSEFCSSCQEDPNTGYDFDLYQMAKKLKKGYTYSFLCEGCYRRGLYRDDEGNLELGIKIGDEVSWKRIELEELKPIKTFRKSNDPLAWIFRRR